MIRDVVLKTDNVRFRKEKYYAASTAKTHLAKLPRGYEGQFGPGVKSLIPALYFGMGSNDPGRDHRKLGLSFYAYLRDRITGAGTIPPLAQLVTQAAQDIGLAQPCPAPSF